MAFNDFEHHLVSKEVKAFVKDFRPPAHIINKLDIVYSFTGQTIDIGERRPVWQGEPGETRLLPAARITYVRNQKVWRLYWMQVDMKWHLYAETDTLTLALKKVRKDAQCCFFG